MDTLALLVMFDSRWLFGFRPPFYEQYLLIPILFNLALLATTIYDKIMNRCIVSESLIEVLVIIVLLILLMTGMYTYLMVKRSQRSKNLPVTNSEKIANFYRQYEARKIIWSWMGLLAFLLSFSLFFIDLTYAIRNGCTIFGPKIFFYLNLAFWVYICMMIFGFLFTKILFLAIAWICPKAFLKLENTYPAPSVAESTAQQIGQNTANP